MEFVFKTRFDAEPPCVVLGLYPEARMWTKEPLCGSDEICRSVADKLDFTYTENLLDSLYWVIDSTYAVDSFCAWELRQWGSSNAI